jgi:hypothetical protein
MMQEDSGAKTPGGDKRAASARLNMVLRIQHFLYVMLAGINDTDKPLLDPGIKHHQAVKMT